MGSFAKLESDINKLKNTQKLIQDVLIYECTFFGRSTKSPQ